MLIPFEGVDDDAARAVLGAAVAMVDHALVIGRREGSGGSIRIVYANEAFERLTGYHLHEVVGVDAAVLVGPQTDPASVERIRVGLARGERVDAEIVLHDRAGAPLRLAGRFDVLPGPGGSWFLSTYRDVSDRTDADTALWHGEIWARTLLAGGTDLVAVIGEDTQVRYVSPALEPMLGYTPDEFSGMAHLDLVHPDDIDLAARGFAGSLDPAELEDGRYTLRLRHRDGTWRILDVATRDLRADPAVAGVVLHARDITGRQQVEHLLAEQAELLEAISRGAPLEITLQKITQMIEHTLPDAAAAIGMIDPDGSIRVRAAPSLPRAVVTHLDELSADGPAGRAVRTSGGDAETFDLSDDASSWSAPFFAQGFRTARIAPILAPGSGELLGALDVLHREVRPLDPFEVDLLDRALNLAAIAVERRRFESTLEYQALYDALTGLPNRTLLHNRVGDAVTRAGRVGTGVAVLFIDLDRFKVINDAVGHALGDELLREVADRFKAPLRPGDTLGRFGGDEFVVVCTRIPDETAAAAAAERFLAELREPFLIGDGEIHVTASIGIAFSDDAAASAESLTRNADVAMYRAKDQGRNQYVIFQENLDLQAVERLALEQALRHAIEAEEFELYFQPVVEMADGAMTHVEALVRWQRPGHGTVSPGVFIPLAEETGLIVPLGWWILDEAARVAAAWPRLPTGGLVEMAVNLSARQLAAPELMEVVADVLARHDLPAHRLCFEVTESALVHDVDQAKASLMELKELGVRLAIDDFGTGYASLDYVRHFSMADYLKIDRSFVEGVEKEGSEEAAIVAAAIALARSLDLTVIAEGVETLFQMEALRRLECDLAQGYLFSRPVPQDAAVELLAGSPGR